MSLKLNTSREAYREFSREASGHLRNVDQMPALKADGRVPMNVSQLTQRRLDMRNSDADVKSSYMDNYFDTGDAVVYHPDGRVKIVLDSQILRDMTPDTPRNSGALIIGEDVYNALEGEEFKKGKLGKINEPLSRKDVKSHPVWKAFQQENKDYNDYNDYTDYIFEEYQARFAKDTPLEDVRAMGVFLGSCGEDKPEMRVWYVGRLEDGSYAYGRNDLDDNDGRLVGIAPEALSAPGKGASNIKAYSMADLQAVDKSMKGLEGTLHPDVLKPFAELRKKL